MSASNAARSLVAAQLEALNARGQPLFGGGDRATVNLAVIYLHMAHATDALHGPTSAHVPAHVSPNSVP